MYDTHLSSKIYLHVVTRYRNQTIKFCGDIWKRAFLFTKNNFFAYLSRVTVLYKGAQRKAITAWENDSEKSQQK